ncbi:MAG: PEGA domain-containing protein, partial [Limisphaerales bacterium]
EVKRSADAGYAESQLQLGGMYASGTGVKKDLGKAAKWQRKAAEQGLARAQYQLGLDYANGEGVKPDPVEAAQWFRKAADQRMVEAEYEVGLCCLYGRGVPENGTEAVSFFRKAAAQGLAYGEYQIGNCYLQGTGVAKDIEEGIKWIRSAAQKGVPPAQNTLGHCYERGQGVPKDTVQAYKWFALAAAQDDEHALDIKVSMAKLEAELTKDQVAQAQKLAREFKPSHELAPADAMSASADYSTTLLQDHPLKLDNPAPGDAKSGWVTVKTDELDCEIFVDGGFVGNSPAKLKLTEGSHVVEVKKTGFKDYRRDLIVLAGSDLTLVPVMQKP